MLIPRSLKTLFDKLGSSVQSIRITPVVISVVTLAALTTNIFSIVVEHRIEVIRSKIQTRLESVRVEEARKRSVSEGKELLALARRENLSSDSFLQRPITYRSLTLPATEVNQVLDRTLNQGLDSFVLIQQFRIAASKSGQSLWGGVADQDSLVLTLIGEQFFRASRD